ncbi:Uncharacterised protein [Streptococcus pneumoniae]|nr:Uncharacterised protein [Streptococcus pneumoniae]
MLEQGLEVRVVLVPGDPHERPEGEECGALARGQVALVLVATEVLAELVEVEGAVEDLVHDVQRGVVLEDVSAPCAHDLTLGHV